MKKITGLFLIILLIGLLSGCSETQFRQDQPAGIKGLAQFPDQFQGYFISTEGDTLIIFETSYRIKNREKNFFQFNNSDTLGKDLILKKWKRHYVINVKEDSLWTVGLLKIDKENNLTLMIIDPENDSLMKAAGQITPVAIFNFEEGNSKLYVFDPSRKAFGKLVKKGLFTPFKVFHKLRTTQK